MRFPFLKIRNSNLSVNRPCLGAAEETKRRMGLEE